MVLTLLESNFLCFLDGLKVFFTIIFKTFSKKNDDWIGSGFIESNDEDVEKSEMIKFSDDAPTVVDIAFCNTDDCLKNNSEQETDEDFDEDNSFWQKVGEWFQDNFSMND